MVILASTITLLSHPNYKLLRGSYDDYGILMVDCRYLLRTYCFEIHLEICFSDNLRQYKI